jgi:L,D-transpeptidase catalytic domain
MRLPHFLFIAASFGLGSLLLASPDSTNPSPTQGEPVAPFTPLFKAGDYVWRPEFSPKGSVVIVVSLAEQVMYVYRNGGRIGRSTISTGHPGHATPTGVFTILEKNVEHTSSIFKGASMPYMERLTWGGVAMHAGNLPGYAASHGCVRLPLDFAQKLYTVTSLGTTVIITNGKSTPNNTAAPGLLFASTTGQSAPVGETVWQPEIAPTGPVSIIISKADRVLYVYRNGVEIGHTPMEGLRGFTGWHVYSALANVDAEGRRDWFATASLGSGAPNIKDLVKATQVDQQFLARTRAMITTGTILILTDAPVNADTRSSSGFNILTTSATP